MKTYRQKRTSGGSKSDEEYQHSVDSLYEYLKIDPASDSLYNGLPFLRVAHDNAAALFVVGTDSHVQDVLPALDICKGSKSMYIYIYAIDAMIYV